MPYLTGYSPKKNTENRTANYTPWTQITLGFSRNKSDLRIKRTGKFLAAALNNLAARTDVVYITDTYGIYNNEWFTLERTGILPGGLSSKDLTFLSSLKNRKKLILTEFNDLASPTIKAFKELFGVPWTGC